MTTQEWLGIAMGLASSLLMAVSYILSRQYVQDERRDMRVLFTVAHTALGVGCAIALPLIWPDQLPPWSDFIWGLIGSSFFYLIAQAGLFDALRFADASRVSPLLGLKVLTLAVLAVLLFGESLSTWQWVAVVMSVIAAWVLHGAGGRLPWRALAGSLLAVVGYALSDLGFKNMLDTFEGDLPPIRGAIFATVLSYLLCGLVTACIVPWYGSRRVKDWTGAIPYSIFWFGAILFLICAFAYLDVVVANIILSTRGLMSIVLGAGVAAAGMIHLEQKVHAGVLWRRLAAAALMSAAIALYMIAGKDGEEAKDAGRAGRAGRAPAALPALPAAGHDANLSPAPHPYEPAS